VGGFLWGGVCGGGGGGGRTQVAMVTSLSSLYGAGSPSILPGTSS